MLARREFANVFIKDASLKSNRIVQRAAVARATSTASSSMLPDPVLLSLGRFFKYRCRVLRARDLGCGRTHLPACRSPAIQQATAESLYALFSSVRRLAVQDACLYFSTRGVFAIGGSQTLTH
jgi:hypothetical protein